MKKLTEYTQAEIQSRITAMTNRNYAVVSKFLSGDHWQSQAGWVGPLALESDGTTSSEGMLVIQEKFVYENVTAEIAGRHLAGVLGENPHWQITPKRLTGTDKPTETESKSIKEIESALTVWLDKRSSDYTEDEITSDVFTQFAVNLIARGRAVFRLFVPDSVNEATVKAATIEEALDKIYIQSPDITQSGVLTDKNTQEKLGTYFYNDTETKYLETTWVKDGITYLKTEINDAAVTTKHKMRGRLFIYESRRKPIVTDSVISLQKLLNMTLTMLGRNVHVGGSPETFFLNAMLPGRTEVVGGKNVYVADPVEVGAGVVHNYTGIPLKDGVTGQTTYTNPNVVFRDPVPVDTFVDTIAVLYRSMLNEAQQLHALISGDATASGEARIQALSDFENSLKETAKCLNAALQWVFESALSLAGSILGNETQFDEYRVMVQCNTNTGPVSTEMLRTLSDVTERNFLSHETGLAKANVRDVDAELQRIEIEKQKAMDEQQQMLGVGAVNQTTQRILNGAVKQSGNANDNQSRVPNTAN